METIEMKLDIYGETAFGQELERAKKHLYLAEDRGHGRLHI